MQVAGETTFSCFSPTQEKLFTSLREQNNSQSPKGLVKGFQKGLNNKVRDGTVQILLQFGFWNNFETDVDLRLSGHHLACMYCTVGIMESDTNAKEHDLINHIPYGKAAS